MNWPSCLEGKRGLKDGNVLLAPNILRVGTDEKVFVEAQDYSGNDLQVRISIKNYPQKRTELTSASTTLTAANNFQSLVNIKIPDNKGFFSNDPLEKQYVYLQAQFPTSLLEKVVLVSFQSGYIFVQTDKSIYKPETTVLYRIFLLTPDLKPIDYPGGINVDIINPHGLKIKGEAIYPTEATIRGEYRIPELAKNVLLAPNILHMGTVEKVFVEAQDYRGNDLQVNISIKDYPQKRTELTSASTTLTAANNFQSLVNINAQFPSSLLEKVVLVSFQSGYIFVQTDKSIYKPETTVLPNFEVALNPSKPFFYMDDEKLEVEITAKYLFGKNVEGVAFVVFEVRRDDKRIALPRSLSRTPITNGVGRVVLTRSMIQQSITNIADLVGGSLFISASVLTQTGSEMVKAEKEDIQIVKSPYTIEFKKTPKYFHPGMPFDVTVYATNPDQSPAENVGVVIRAGQEGEVRALTRRNGFAKVTVNTNERWSSLEITAKTEVPDISAERQAENKMIAEAYATKGGSRNYLHISADSAELAINDETKFQLIVQSSVQDQDLTYLIFSKGQIVKAERLKRKELISLSERITKDLVPSFRLVAYYHIGSEIVSDSIWVAIKDTCLGTLKLDVKQSLSGQILFNPGEEFDLVVTGDPSAKVGLVALDMGVLALNKNRLTQSKIWNLIENYYTGCTAGSGKDSMGVFYDAGLLFQSDKAGGTKERTGICVADPYEIIVTKDFLVDLVLPSTAVRNEQVEIKAILYNFSNKQQKVRVDFFETEHICSAASKKKKYHTVVNVDAKSSRSVPFVIIPMRIGEHDIKVQAASTYYNDGVRKTLKVVPDGVLTKLLETNLELNPSQYPGQKVSQTIEQVISGDFVGRLIRKPIGSGDQLMISMTLSLTATHYLDTTNQWEAVGLDRRNEAIQHITTGYAEELNFRKEDGSYAPFLSRPSSTWLTAYVVKVFAMASDYISIDKNVLCSAIKWLILNAQMADGTFKKSSKVIYSQMVNVPGSSNKALDYLERRLPSLNNPYAIAMTSYALANAGKFNKDRLLQASSEDGSNWQVPGGQFFSVEATAYALLALVKAKEFDAAGKVVRWLNRQSINYGSYGTTQATIIVFQAMAEYYKKVRVQEDLYLEVELRVRERSHPIKWIFNSESAHMTSSDKVQLQQEFNVTAKGTGAGVLKVMNIYYAKPIEKKIECKSYTVSVELKKEAKTSYNDAEESYMLTINVLYNNPNRDATMTILDIGLLTGFVVDKRDLTELSSGNDKYIQKFEMDKELSERGSLIIYLDKERCVKFYHPTKKEVALSRLCSNQEGLCECAEENCSIQKKLNIEQNERELRACEAGTDYVYKVKVVETNLNPNTDFYEMEIEEILREGIDRVNPGNQRTFMGLAKCRSAFNFVKGKSYLLMGQRSNLLWKDKSSGRSLNSGVERDYLRPSVESILQSSLISTYVAQEQKKAQARQQRGSCDLEQPKVTELRLKEQALRQREQDLKEREERLERSEMVKAEKEDIQIVKSPYTIEFKKTPKYFHPGMPFDVTSPAENVGVVIRAGQEGEVRALTRRNGFAIVTVNTNERWSSLEITILSKGQIVKAERLKKKEQMILSERITKDLVPSFRLVAYYHIGSEIVSDSIRVELKLNVKQMSKKVFQTGENFNLVVTGDPSAKVGLVAVDKRVFLLNKNRLTQSKIWNLIEKYDTGCTPGSGKDSMGVFYDAGLLFQSDKAGGTKERTVGKFAKDLKKCCEDGIRQTRLDYTCEQRSTFIMEDSECVKAFLDCCTEIRSHKDKQRPLVRLARSDDDDDDDYDDDDFISFFTRTHFPESWLWEDISLPACPGNKPCTTTTLTMDTNYLQDSITTWQILAISLSKTHGICAADPYEITVVKDFFVDLKLPYSAVHNEQVEIKAILYNLSNMLQKVRLEFFETEQICSVANKKKKYRSIVNIDPNSSRSVPFLIIPMKIGDHHIEVKAASGSYHDGVRKTLKVMPEGMLTEILETNLKLNPSQFPGGIQTVQMKTDIPSGQVPNTPAHSQIIVTGQQVSQTIEQVISGDFMGRLIIKPIGSGDQVMISMTLPLTATHYLDTTNQWEAVGLHKRNEAIQHIKTGYLQELKFRKDDGSYASFLTRPSSTWLTAYVVKVFAMATDYISIDKNVLCSAIKWLILNAQMPDGTFKERSPVVHLEMVGDVRGKDSDASLTAFVLIAVQEGNHLCATYVSSILESSSKALNYLERRLLSLNNPYAIAMTSYALAKAGKFNKDHLLQASSEDGSYWQVPGGQFFSVEATAYALLALVKAKEFNAAGKAVRWLNRQSINYGGHGTTQATIMVFQAVTEYYKQVSHRKNVDLMVEVRVSERHRPVKWIFNSENLQLTYTYKVQLQQEFNVTAKGTGAGVFKVMTIYYARPIEKKSNCKNYTVSLEMKREAKTSYSNAEESYMFTINVLYNDPNGDAPMTILDIGLLTGFVVDKRDLTDLSSENDKYIQKFEMNEELSERGSLIIYLDKVSHTVPDRIAFRMHKINKVNMLQPAAVSVYEYYSPEERCVKFYHPTKNEGALSMLCSNREGLCECAEVYKAKVVEMNLNPNTDFYEMEIEEILREGIDQVKPGNRTSFMGRADCRSAFNFVKGKSYLLMGQRSNILKEDSSTNADIRRFGFKKMLQETPRITSQTHVMSNDSAADLPSFTQNFTFVLLFGLAIRDEIADSPAEDVDVVIKVDKDQREVKGRTKSNGMAKVIVNTQGGWKTVDITARTDVPGISAERQAQNKMIADAYTTKEYSGNYLHISADSAELQINDETKFQLNFKSSVQDQDLTYLLKLSVKDNPDGKIFEPGDEFKLVVTGDPSAKVGLVAVDKGVFVLNKNRLTQSKIWNLIEKYDTGCTAGSGKDSMGVFYDAGLLFQSDKAGGTKERTDDDDDFISSDEIVTRTQFPESWLWEYINLPACSGNQCTTTSITMETLFPEDSITTWQLLAISLSKTHGICVTDPFEITVAKEFFVDLKLPYSAVHNEQVEIKAILYNFSKRRQMVRVEFFETDHICSTASKKKKYRTIVNVDPNSSRSVPFVIIPMKIGEHHIEVQAASSSYHDGVRRTLKVVSEGVLTEQLEANMELNPSQAPGQKVSQAIKQAISGDFMGHLIVQPTGSGEQNMIYMTLPLIATHYLDTTEQWEGVGLGRRNEAIQHITTGYTRELTYRKPDGSYAAWLSRHSSTWLTAYVAKVFAMASDLIHIEENVICSAIKWLTLNVQMPDGTFIEKAPVVQSEMVHLLESSNKALDYLESRLPSLTNPYAIAMTSYALANAGKFNKDRLLQASSEGGSYWEVPGGQFFSVEATAYALLALVKAKEFDAAGKVVRWLNRQSIHYGGHGTTQATIMVFQAVAEYYKQVGIN
ncbi:complement component c3a precursor [Silurus meridionalis]|nr:complement component c3a precursor [Silurus meridionalis]